MRLPEKITKLYEKISELENRVEDLEKKVNVGKVDQIGFSIDNSESSSYEETWDDTPSIYPMHWESDILWQENQD